MTSVDVVGRGVLNRPIPGTVELSQYLLSVFILLGFAYTQQAKAHVTVSLFTSRLPYRAQLILQIITTLLLLFVCCIIAWQGWVVGIEEKTVSDMLRVPQYPFRLLVAFAACTLCLQLLTDLGDSLKKLAGRAS
jgi:TRAP-type C4-dicarboxylate transport system permease small subunit